jgi:hypothetical protein
VITGYDAGVFARAGRHAVELVVGVFALLGFVFVPLGQKTGLEHLKAIVHTDAAQQAIQGVSQALGGLRGRAVEVLAPPPAPSATEAPAKKPSDLSRSAASHPPAFPEHSAKDNQCSANPVSACLPPDP